MAQALCAILVAGIFAVHCNNAFAASGPESQPLTVAFGGRPFIHRWSKDNQNEFTPEGQTDLTKWNEMVTINIHANVKDSDQLAALANSVLSNYQRSGKIVRTDSKPRTEKRPAEHLIVAILGAPGVTETAFARLMLVDGRGIIAVYSRRAYGEDGATTIGKWLQTS